ncbi:MAG: diaminobutyrate--2-oxoglutarate transaminase [Cyanobacteriota bacterium]|nr:diaminobutyrate--2-oxoglutarate transaminase [Cyanobacteriota bacterium]
MLQAEINTFTRLESKVRSYCNSFPTVFVKAAGSHILDEQGHQFIDFFAGAGSLNYGHNNPQFRQCLLNYIDSEGITQSLDMFTVAKREFLERFEQVILKPRGLEYRFMFTGPTGTNAVEASLKLARKVTGRETIASFKRGFHGMTLGALAVTTNPYYRKAAGVSLNHSIFLPFHTQPGREADEINHLQQLIDGLKREGKKPAACVLETVQAEGGVNVASIPWLGQLSKLLQAEKILLVVDDIQVGCGRTGPFFSFERAGLKPDLICLSKSLSGYGIPLSLVLIRPDLDCWEPGEHNGTFRGHNLAFVTAKAALDYWETNTLEQEVIQKANIVSDRLKKLMVKSTNLGEVRGVGLIQGIVCNPPELAQQISKQAFKRGLIIETAGLKDEVLKVLPPLTIESRVLYEGLDILEASVEAALTDQTFLQK